jgi:hypothetical protein
MRFIKASIITSVLAIVGSLSLSGCYTQLAVSQDESAYADSQATPNSQISGSIYTIDPSSYHRAPREDYYPMLPAGAALPGTGTASQPESPHRESGYQRSSTPAQNDNSRTQTTGTQAPKTNSSNATGRSAPPSSGSDTRTSGTTRGGR